MSFTDDRGNKIEGSQIFATRDAEPSEGIQGEVFVTRNNKPLFISSKVASVGIGDFILDTDYNGKVLSLKPVK